jgi:hypothetical protein
LLKSVVMHDIPIDYVAAMERWYYRDHAPEINRRFGPWLVRHDSYLPVDAPADARAYGWFNWRVTEGYWREMPSPGPQGNLAFTEPPIHPRVAAGFFPAQPTEDFKGGQITPAERQVLRWFTMLRYPAGVSAEAGESWFLEQHARELCACAGAFRIFSTRRHAGPVPLPGEWAPGKGPPAANLSGQWDRLSEFWFETFSDWRTFIKDVEQRCTAPRWASAARYPFIVPGVDFISSFLLERPSDEFARDARGYL